MTRTILLKIKPGESSSRVTQHAKALTEAGYSVQIIEDDQANTASDAADVDMGSGTSSTADSAATESANGLSSSIDDDVGLQTTTTPRERLVVDLSSIEKEHPSWSSSDVVNMLENHLKRGDRDRCLSGSSAMPVTIPTEKSRDRSTSPDSPLPALKQPPRTRRSTEASSAASPARFAVPKSLKLFPENETLPLSWSEVADKEPLTRLEEFWKDHRAEAGRSYMLVGDVIFRKIVKMFCNFPAYFGLVLHERMAEYRQYEKMLKDYIAFANNVSQPGWLRETGNAEGVATPSSRRSGVYSPLQSSDNEEGDVSMEGPVTPSTPTHDVRHSPPHGGGAQHQYSDRSMAVPHPSQYGLHPSTAPAIPVHILIQRGLLTEETNYKRSEKMAVTAMDEGTYVDTPERYTNYDKAQSAIEMNDFLRFWTPRVHQGDRISKWLALVTPPDVAPQFDALRQELDESWPQIKRRMSDPAILKSEGSQEAKLDFLSAAAGSAGKGHKRSSRNVSSVYCKTLYPLRFPSPRIRMCDVRPLVEALVDRHPDLAIVRKDKKLREQYVISALTSIFASLHGMCTGVITRAEIRESNLVDAFHTCATRSLNSLIPFSITYFREVKRAWDEVNLHNTVLVTKEDVQKSGQIGVADYALDRIFSGVPRPLVSSQEGHMCFEDFMWLWLANKDRMSETSLEYWFRILDLDDDGVLGLLDLECSYENRVHQLAEAGEPTPTGTPNAMNQLADVIKPKYFGRVSCLEIRRSNAGPIVFDLTLALKGSPASKNYLM